MKPKNLPKEIWLQIGEDRDGEDFKELSGVTWCEEKINSNDIRYILDKRQASKSARGVS